MCNWQNYLRSSHINALSPQTNLVDNLLADVAIRVQLSRSNYRKAVERYKAITQWIERFPSPLKDRVLSYPQGSMAIGATIASKLRTDEFDIDVLAQLALPENIASHIPLDLLFEVIKGEPGSRYYSLTRRRTRCVTVDYADNMHIDITPALRCPCTRERESWIFHHDPKELQQKSFRLIANPYGFAEWFNLNTPSDIEFARNFETRTNLYENSILRADSEPVPPQESPFHKSKAAIVLQLLKRWRNVQYDNRSVRRPPSIMMAKLVADFATDPHRSLSRELHFQTRMMLSTLLRWHTVGKRIEVRNPICAEDILTDRWPETLGDQEMFIHDLQNLSKKIERLCAGCDLGLMKAILVELFGEAPTSEIFHDLNQRLGSTISWGQSGYSP